MRELGGNVTKGEGEDDGDAEEECNAGDAEVVARAVYILAVHGAFADEGDCDAYGSE